MMTDPIADMLTRIRNAIHARHKSVLIPYSRLKEAILRVLDAEGYIVSFQSVEAGKKRWLQVTLRSKGSGEYPIEGLRRVSRPGRRVYSPCSKIPRSLSGFGLIVLSTPRGVLSDQQAREAKVGGEILCEVW